MEKYTPEHILECIRYNVVCVICRSEKITMSEFSRRTSIERTRVHRLAHMKKEDLRRSLTISEAMKISSAFPHQSISF